MAQKVKLNDTNDFLQAAIKEIEKEYGNGAIMTLGSKSNYQISSISSGSLLLDQAIGIGGYPKGRIIEIYGPESSAKTTLSLHAIAEVQKQNRQAVFIDAEHALDPCYAQKLGVNIEKLIIAQPDSGEQALDILEILVKSQAIDIVIIDSVAALVPQVELDGEMSDQTIGAQARLMSRGLRRLNSTISKTNCIVIFINQIREKVGVIFGNPEITPGGRALRFYSSLRLELRRGEQIVKENQTIGHKIKIKIVKNKVAPPFQSVILDFYFEYGISRINEIIDLAVLKNIVSKSGPWFLYENEKIGPGKEKLRQYLEMNKEILNNILSKLN